MSSRYIRKLYIYLPANADKVSIPMNTVLYKDKNMLLRYKNKNKHNIWPVQQENSLRRCTETTRTRIFYTAMEKKQNESYDYNNWGHCLVGSVF